MYRVSSRYACFQGFKVANINVEIQIVKSLEKDSVWTSAYLVNAFTDSFLITGEVCIVTVEKETLVAWYSFIDQ
jgi:hypothetical protein